MPDTTIAPALTPDEWDGLAFSERDEDKDATVVDAQGEPSMLTVTPLELLTEGDFAGSYGVGLGSRQRIDIERRHGVAALALYGQPFGFTREEVRELAIVADELDNDLLHTIALKLDALLPPLPPSSLTE